MITCPHCKRAIYPGRNATQWDAEKRLLVYRGEVAQLSPQEADFFSMLFEADGQLVRRSRVMARLYGLMDVDAENCLSVVVSKLRKKLPTGVTINTIWNYNDEGGFWLEWG